VLTVVACATLLHAAPLRAESAPCAASMRIGVTLDAAAFVRGVAARYRIELRHVVAADIDRDGDLDVVASTDRGFLVWVNDGSGRLTSQTPQPKTGLDGRSPGETWSGGRSRGDETIQNDAPSTRLATSYAHAPPPSASSALPSLSSDCQPRVRRSAHVPRAPPLARP